MKTLTMINAAVLSALLAIALPAIAQEQHDQEQKAMPARQEEKRAEPAKSTQKEATPAEQERARPAVEGPSIKSAPELKEQHPAQATQQRSGGGNHARIPDDRFRAGFGREHAFAINRPDMYQGAPRFQYGGYWFGFGQPWPVGWRYSDNVYVEYEDGEYYLYNPIHPGIRIIINLM